MNSVREWQDGICTTYPLYPGKSGAIGHKTRLSNGFWAGLVPQQAHFGLDFKPEQAFMRACLSLLGLRCSICSNSNCVNQTRAK